MKFDFDAIVIGSGFGGSVMSLRLVEKGYHVCLLERGKSYGMHEFPRGVEDVKDNLFWDPKDGCFGPMEVRDYPESDAMSVTGSGLGGGSLIYANVLLRMPREYFKTWPCGITGELLEPFYKEALSMFDASPYPMNDPYYADTPKTNELKKASSQIQKEEDMIHSPRHFFPDLAINFKGEFPGEQKLNKHGAIQSKCNKCGACDIGCNIHAKNTTDLNYLFKAEKLGLEIRTHAEVLEVRPLSEGYEVKYQNPLDKSDTKVIKAKKVILSAGVLGSNKILLEMKKQNILPNLSPMLGKKWSGNGDLLGFSFGCDEKINPAVGPVITSAIEYRFRPFEKDTPSTVFIEDAGAPAGLEWYLSGKLLSPKSTFEALKLACHVIWNRLLDFFGLKNQNFEINLGKEVANSIDDSKSISRLFPLLGMGKDINDGEIELRNDGEPVIKWQVERSKTHFDRMRKEMKKLSHSLGGHYIDNPTTLFEKFISVHPLGGCIIGENENDGVVGKNGEVFGYKGLYVADGSVIPTSIGPNPSLTIAAVSEYFASQIPKLKKEEAYKKKSDAIL